VLFADAPCKMIKGFTVIADYWTMITWYRNFVDQYIYNDSLSFDAKILNMICCVGTVALLISMVGHIIERSHWIVLAIKLAMIISALTVFHLCNKYKTHRYGNIVAIIGFLCGNFFLYYEQKTLSLCKK